MVWQALAAGMLGNNPNIFGGGSSGSPDLGPVQSGVDNVRNNINVAPVGVNLGEIIKPYEESVFNGGMGLRAPNRIVDAVGLSAKPSFSALGLTGGNGIMPLVLLGAAVLAVIFAVRGS